MKYNIAKKRVSYGEAALIVWFHRAQTLPNDYPGLYWGSPDIMHQIKEVATHNANVMADGSWRQGFFIPGYISQQLSKSPYFNSAFIRGVASGFVGQQGATIHRPNDNGRVHYEKNLKHLLAGVPLFDEVD